MSIESWESEWTPIAARIIIYKEWRVKWTNHTPLNVLTLTYIHWEQMWFDPSYGCQHFCTRGSGHHDYPKMITLHTFISFAFLLQRCFSANEESRMEDIDALKITRKIYHSDAEQTSKREWRILFDDNQNNVRCYWDFFFWAFPCIFSIFI